MKGLDSLGPVVRRRNWRENRFRSARRHGRVTLGFLGGSITSPRTGTRWPELLVEAMRQRWPDLEVRVENAAVGATGSDWAVFRTCPDIVARGCDLVFLEHSVNDHDHPPARRMRTREGIVRQLLAAGIDVVLVHTFRPEMLADMEAGVVPASIADFELLAEHYGLTSVWVGLAALRSVRAGVMPWTQWLPDGLHPELPGSQLYAAPVLGLLEEIDGDEECSRPGLLPVAKDPECWSEVALIDWQQLLCTGPWVMRRTTRCFGMAEGLECNAIGAILRGWFQGRTLVVAVGFGRDAGELRWRIDGGPWCETARERPDWAEEVGWYRPEILAEDLPLGRHCFEIETLGASTEQGGGTQTLIGFIGVVG